jgi:hypothetical protein
VIISKKVEIYMTKLQAVQLFEQKQVRTVWDEEQEKWYFSIVDVVGVLSDSVDATVYWRKLKQRLKAEGNETVTNCHGLKMLAELSTKEISGATKPDSFNEHINVAKQGGEIARNARLELEEKTGKPVVSPLNAKDGIMLKEHEE